MALSNKFGWLVLTTGNKSEYSVGYTTLYGDMAGGFGVLKDVPKTWVYRLAAVPQREAVAAGDPARRSSSGRRPPSCKPGQLDQDSLPPYDLLDVILEAYIEEDLDREQLIRRGTSRARRRPGDQARRPRRVQAPPGATRDQDQPEGVRPRPAAADHEPFRRMSPGTVLTAATRRRKSTAARSGPAPGHDGDRRAHQRASVAVVVGDLDVPDPGRAAALAHASPCRSRGPSVIERIRLALISWPIASIAVVGVHALPGPAGGERLGQRQHRAPCTSRSGWRIAVRDRHRAPDDSVRESSVLHAERRRRSSASRGADIHGRVGHDAGPRAAGSACPGS